MEHDIRNGTIRWQISNLYKTLHIFALTHTVFAILTFKMFDREQLCRGRRVQHS